MKTFEDIQRLVHLKDRDKKAIHKLIQGKATLSAEDIQRLVMLKAVDKEMFYRLLDELRHAPPFDVLLSYKKFKEYAPNV